MPLIDITAVGATGTHTLQRTNVNLEENTLYYSGLSGNTPRQYPAWAADGNPWIYRSSIASITGLTSGNLLYTKKLDAFSVAFASTLNGTTIDITDVTAGAVTLNFPFVFNNQLNISALYSNQQAVKYFTNSAPLTGLVSGNTYFVRNNAASGIGTAPLYSFTNLTFGTAGTTGQNAPSLGTLVTAYTGAGASWASNTLYFNQGNYAGYQDWTVPVTGVYELTVAGAPGKSSTSSAGGFAPIVKGRVNLTRGEIITIAVGQKGFLNTLNGAWPGASGGTFVIRKNGNIPLLIAGGGQSASFTNPGTTTPLVTTSAGPSSSGGGTPGVNGNGGSASNPSGGGAGGGFLSNGAASSFGAGGNGFNSGLRGGDGSPAGNSSAGGFGGGGGSDAQTYGSPGGSGGYSGGGTGGPTGGGDSRGGYGGSFIATSVTNVATSTGLYNGSASFNGKPITNLAAYNSSQSNEGSVAVTLVQSSNSGTTLHPTGADAFANTNAIAIAPAGTEYHSLVPITLDLVANTFNYPDAHGLVSGDAVTYTVSANGVGGLTANAVYYVNRVDNYTYKLSSTPSPTFTDVDITIPSIASDDVFRKVVVNTATEIITIPSHGFQANQPVKYSTGGGTAIAPLQNNATYYVGTVVDNNNITLSLTLDNAAPINFTSAGTGTTHSFIYVVVNLDDESLYIPGHELVTGSKVVYSAGAGTPIGGLTSGGTYFINRVNANIVKLATNKEGTLIVNLTSLGTGNHTLTTNSVDFTTETISIPSHGFSQGELVQYDSVGQTAIGGLVSGNPYYIILVDGDNIRLALTLADANAGTAINLTTAGVGRHRILSLSKSPDGTYTISTVPDAYTFTVPANGFVPFIVKTFTPRAVVDIQQNNLKILSHGFVTGTKVLYSAAGGTAVGGLINATNYFAININKDYIQLASSAENASSGVPIVFSSFGGGIDHTLTSAQINGFVTGSGTVSTASGSTLVNGVNTAFAKILKVGDRFRLFPPNTLTTGAFASTAVTINPTNTLTLTAHAFNTGDSVLYVAGSGSVAPTGLTSNQFYFVRRIDANTVKLFNTSADAVANTNPVIFTTQGSGSTHSIVRTLPSSPIIRRITAIGSDTQITVDRPYSTAYSSVAYSYSTFIYVRPQGYSLHRPFDGGVEMSTGVGTSNASIIRQTRKYFRYQSGKGIQTSCGINFKPTIDLENMVRLSATTFQATTRRPHGLISGLYIKISEALDSAGLTSNIYNGAFQVTVNDAVTFTCIAATPIPTGAEAKAYGYPQFNVTSWQNGAIRSGMFDSQNGMFYEFDGQKMYAVRRSSTQQIAGTASVIQGSEFVFGTGTTFTTQLKAGDYIVMRGMTHKVSSVISDTRMTIKPEYRGASGTEKEFNPGNGTTGVVRISSSTPSNMFVIQGHGFTNNLPVIYDSIDGTPIGGLINGRTYYVDLTSAGTDNNNFRLKASPDATQSVTLSNVGAGTPHSFTPAKSGIIITKTVDLRVPQEQWSIDPCDGTGPTGYNLDLGTIQMCYIDYSWYGAGKIRFGFKGKTGEVIYVHEFIHNNHLLESYFRSGNLPARYEVTTYSNPTYVPFLFHWGTSVIMDGKFDDDKAYLFTQSSQTLSIPGTTPKSFGSKAVTLATDAINIPTHGFTTGDAVTFIGITAAGLAGSNAQNQAIVAQNPAYNFNNLQNSSTLYVRSVDVNNVTLHPTNADAIATGGTNRIDITSQGNAQYTYYLYPLGSYNNTSGPNYQPLISIRLSPSVSSGLTGKLGDRDVINRMQLRMREIAVQTTNLCDVKVLINARLNNLNFAPVTSPSLTQIIAHTANDTISGGVQIYNFRAAGQGGTEASTTVDISDLFELSNSILGGDSVFPDGPDILTIAVSRLTGGSTVTGAKLTWTEAQA